VTPSRLKGEALPQGSRTAAQAAAPVRSASLSNTQREDLQNTPETKLDTRQTHSRTRERARRARQEKLIFVVSEQSKPTGQHKLIELARGRVEGGGKKRRKRDRKGKGKLSQSLRPKTKIKNWKTKHRPMKRWWR
jgi:hypothetical protein